MDSGSCPGGQVRVGQGRSGAVQGQGPLFWQILTAVGGAQARGPRRPPFWSPWRQTPCIQPGQARRVRGRSQLGLQCSAAAGGRSAGRRLTASRLREPGCLRTGCLQRLVVCWVLCFYPLRCGVSFPGRLTSLGPPPGVLTSQEITVGLPPWKASCPCPCAAEERGSPGTACPMPRDQERNKRATKKTRQAVSPLSLCSWNK